MGSDAKDGVRQMLRSSELEGRTTAVASVGLQVVRHWNIVGTIHQGSGGRLCLTDLRVLLCKGLAKQSGRAKCRIGPVGNQGERGGRSFRGELGRSLTGRSVCAQ